MKSRCAMYNLYICTLYFSDNRFTAGTRSPNEISQELRKWSIVINGRQGYRLRAWHGLESAGQGFMVIDEFLVMDCQSFSAFPRSPPCPYTCLSHSKTITLSEYCPKTSSRTSDFGTPMLSFNCPAN